jgi:DNA polymerase III sliding clamp (beta) subunit (PCNA family)
VLGACGGEEILIGVDTPERAVTFTPQNEADGQSSLFLIMPLRLLD